MTIDDSFRKEHAQLLVTDIGQSNERSCHMCTGKRPQSIEMVTLENNYLCVWGRLSCTIFPRQLQRCHMFCITRLMTWVSDCFGMTDPTHSPDLSLTPVATSVNALFCRSNQYSQESNICIYIYVYIFINIYINTYIRPCLRSHTHQVSAL